MNGVARGGVARLNGDGSLDLSFHPGTGVTGTVYTVCALTNGSVFIGGDFSTVDGTNRSRYALLRKDGAVSVAFDSRLGANGTVFASLVTPDQKVIIGGDFTTVGGVSRRGVARLNVGAEAVAALLSVPRFNGSTAEVSVTTTPNFRYVLEGSGDLLYWLPLQTNLASGASLILTDANASGAGRRFYRVRVEV